MSKAEVDQEHPIPDVPVIVFDGMCVLCSANAQFVLKFDRNRVFHLAAMQDSVGADLMRRAGLDPSDPMSLVVFDDGRIWRDSDAVIRIYDQMGWPWRIASVGRLIPRALRDPLYHLIARNRYRIFGKRETCWVPTPEQASRIL
ncbi:thiol-disulfide oxidoreductase DCC family protein [Erythrobacter sp. F6033]|uniref:thiol-disulfide oxidoreductase DCC family protein n=1 Tax=Erythrobacter sp. F6033 TaxID=2926401 RepID=UPI001FF4761E|nr:thiol-disulfide oxidoreductase DCC family protein [Erythrobacter sp. F6033]MCK0127162.1 thiol-disulfide oxidoreductase DCC family protein [Erythrobacter sp. F6033]